MIGGPLRESTASTSCQADVAIRLLLDFLDGGERSTAAAWERQ